MGPGAAGHCGVELKAGLGEGLQLRHGVSMGGVVQVVVRGVTHHSSWCRNILLDLKKNLMLQETYNPGRTIQINALNPNDPLNIHVFIITSGLQNGSSVTIIVLSIRETNYTFNYAKAPMLVAQACVTLRLCLSHWLFVLSLLEVRSSSGSLEKHN